MKIKAIQTTYKGFRFRSRLEARWAVFFDAIGVKWIYEPEGYKMKNTCYLPDFYLPELRHYIEIKPDFPSALELTKMCNLANGRNAEHGHHQLHYIICGQPTMPKWKMLGQSNGQVTLHPIDGYFALGVTGQSRPVHTLAWAGSHADSCGYSLWHLYIDEGSIYDPHGKTISLSRSASGIMESPINTPIRKIKRGGSYLSLKFSDPNTMRPFLMQHVYCGPSNGRDFYDSRIMRAYEKAKSARFEFGDKP